jgi:AcrR family transcriptional regulator
MARRNDHTREEIREMAILAGSKLINELGFTGFSSRQIAKEIGYTVGTLYNVFESYDDIILHINATTLDEMKKFITQNINQKLKNSEAIKQLAKLYAKFAHANYRNWNALFEYTSPSPIPAWYNEKIESLFIIVENILSEFISKKSDAKKHSKVIWASIHGICILSLTNKLDVDGTKSIEALTDLLVENYLSGLAK